MRDYEVLRRELPNDSEVAESLFHAQVALKKSRGEDVYNMKFGGDVESVSGLEQFKAAISSSGKCFRSIINNTTIYWWLYNDAAMECRKCRFIGGTFQIRDQSTMQAHISFCRCIMQPVSVHQFSPGKPLSLN